MPNIKSAIKRVSVIKKKTEMNNMIKTGYRTVVKKFEQAVEDKNVEEATKLLVEATKKIDQACTKGIITKNTASRKKSKMAKKLNAISDKKPAKKAEKKETVKEEKAEKKPATKKATTTKKTTTTAKKATTKKADKE
jgi:small subunit ribosomal protein S20